MSELSDKTICVVDHGDHVELAIRLARESKRVLYYSTWERSFPTVHECMVGDGFDEIERCNDVWEVKNDVDLWCFPDNHYEGLQVELESQGKRIFGGRTGDFIEIERERFKKALKSIGLEVGPYKVVRGLTALRNYLSEHDDVYVKISKYRGDMETFHWQNQFVSGGYLDELAVRFGAVKEWVPFVVEQPIETKLELGFDGICVDGEFAQNAGINGIECKNKGYICTVRPYADLPTELLEVNDALEEMLSSYKYRNFFSTEVRVSEDDKAYLTDPCCRMPSPAGECELELITNLGDVMWAASEGEVIDLEMASEFAVECIIDHTASATTWRNIEIPDDIREWVKLYSPVKVADGSYALPPDPREEQCIGAVVGLGDTIEAAIDHLKSTIEVLNGQPLTIKVESLVDVLKEIAESEKQDIEFSDQPIPEPQTVIEDK